MNRIWSCANTDTCKVMNGNCKVIINNWVNSTFSVQNRIIPLQQDFSLGREWRCPERQTALQRPVEAQPVPPTPPTLPPTLPPLPPPNFWFCAESERHNRMIRSSFQRGFWRGLRDGMAADSSWDPGRAKRWCRYCVSISGLRDWLRSVTSLMSPVVSGRLFGSM